MNVILFMVMSVNGKIANPDGAYPWASKEDWESFQRMYTKVGCIIIGKKTYDKLKDKPTFPTAGCTCVVMSKDKTFTCNHPRVIAAHDSPFDTLTMLEKKGFKQVLIGGGGQINSLFMKQGLIDEVYIDIEPIVVGKGVPLFAESDFQSCLKLISVKTLPNHQTIQLHYKVLK